MEVVPFIYLLLWWILLSELHWWWLFSFITQVLISERTYSGDQSDSDQMFWYWQLHLSFPSQGSVTLSSGSKSEFVKPDLWNTTLTSLWWWEASPYVGADKPWWVHSVGNWLPAAGDNCHAASSSLPSALWLTCSHGTNVAAGAMLTGEFLPLLLEVWQSLDPFITTLEIQTSQ